MWHSHSKGSSGGGIKKGPVTGLVAVAIDRDKGSQHAIRWAAENLLSKGKTVILIHVFHQHDPSSGSAMHHPVASCNNDGGFSPAHKQLLEKLTKDLFVTFHCYCTRKDIPCFDVILEGTDVAKAIADYVNYAAIEYLVLGASSRHGFMRFKTSHIPSSVSKAAPDFCTVYVISKGKISSMRNASRGAPFASPILEQIEDVKEQYIGFERNFTNSMRERRPRKLANTHDDSIRSPLFRGRASPHGDMSESETDISFMSSGRPSSDHTFLCDDIDAALSSRISTSTDSLSMRSGYKWNDTSPLHDFSSVSEESGRTSCSFSSHYMDEVEHEIRRLRLELKQTMDMYSTACKEALIAKQKAMELQHWKLEEERILEESRLAQEAAESIAEKERAKCRAAIETAEASRRIAELEAERRVKAEMKAMRDVEEMKKMLERLNDMRYRKYRIEEIEVATDFFAESYKIGEGGYGPVYKCNLDHTPVAVKVLRPGAAHGRTQFQQEVEVLSRIRHPNMVLLLGACPEYGCLVYEYMANGSLEDRLFRKGNTPVLSWRLRFRIAAEITTSLTFLHQTKPEPLVHRDLKPANILLDSHYVSKISDVGLARLVPQDVADNKTQCQMIATAGTFSYIDPEYQQTGVLGVKSDIYSLGIVLLQLITAKPPMGVTHHIDQAIESGNFSDVLDPVVTDWPVEEALCLAKLAMQCAEMKRKDRPDLATVVLPELTKLRNFAEENTNDVLWGTAPYKGPFSVVQDIISDHSLVHSDSSPAHSNTSV
ncbi:U-box domain-containing protein 52-like [Punica granatum]|uniref:RING-type E3 ubiquitin transferase n=1 Tax=Punica granatum TaxID=22663 RepID=A0A6P8CK33_PUNGR|nr:U-box domain-containing protein 52-like [Punica granatum]